MVEVRGATCAFDYSVELDQEEFADAAPVFRGLEEAEGLIALGEGASPSLGDRSAGDATEEGLRSVPELFGRMHTPEGARGVRVLLEGELRRLEDTYDALDRQTERYKFFVEREKRKTNQIWNDLQSALKLLQKAGTCSDLEEIRQRFVLLHSQVAVSRSEMLAAPDASLPAAFESRVGELIARVTLMETQIEAQSAAVRAALVSGRRGAANREAFLQTFKRLNGTYGGDKFPDSMLWELADTYAAVRQAKGEGSVVEAWKESSAWLMGDGKTRIGKLRKNTVSLHCRVMDSYDGLLSEVDKVNSDLKAGRSALSDAYSEFKQPNRAWLVAGGDRNRTVNIRILERFLLETGVRSVEGAGGSEAATEEAAGGSLVGAPFLEVANHTYEFHRSNRFNIGGGIFLSGINEQEFSVRSTVRLDDFGDPVLGDDGGPVMDLLAVEAGENSHTRDLGLFVTTYFRRQDRFPGPGAYRRAWGAVFGFSVDRPEDNLFLGLSVQPTLGVQVIGGFHLGRVRVLEDGIDLGVTALPVGTVEAPTREKWDTEPFLAIVLDVGVFRRIFGFGAGS